DLGRAAELGARRLALEVTQAGHVRVVLERDQDLRYVPLLRVAEQEPVAGKRHEQVREARHRAEGYAAPRSTLASLAPPAPGPAPRQLSLLRDSIPYSVRRSERARRVRVHVDPSGEVEVVLPRRAPDRAAAAAIRELRPWIERRRAEALEARRRVAARAG